MAGAVLLPFFLFVATVGRGFADPSLHGPLVVVTIVALAGSVALEVNVRAAHITAVGGQLRWRLRGDWKDHEKSIASIERIEQASNGDVAIYFMGEQPVRASAKEFRRDDLRELVKVLSVDRGQAPA